MNSRRAAATHAYLRCARRLAADGKSAHARKIYRQPTDPSEPLHIRRGAFIGQVALGGPQAVDLIIATLRSRDQQLEPTAVAAIRTLPAPPPK